MDTGRRKKKMYILLFTCLNIIVIHLVLVKDMSTHSVKQVFVSDVFVGMLSTFNIKHLTFLCIRLGLGASGRDL